MANPASPSNPLNLKTYTFKLVLLGEMSVGKSSLVLQFVKGHFDPKHETTIGAAYLTQTINLDDATVKFEIWDTAGQERYHSLAPMYYRGAHAAIIVYDVSSPESFARAKAWIKELGIQRQSAPNMVMALAGNKCDLRATKPASQCVSRETAIAYAEESDLLFMETSAMKGINVHELFEAIARKLPKSARIQTETPGAKVNPGAPSPNIASNDGCC